MRYFIASISYFLLLATLPAFCAEISGFQSVQIGRFKPVQVLIPLSIKADRLYVRVHFKEHVVGATAEIDHHTLVRAIGTDQTASLPTALAQGYGSAFTDVASFARQPFQKIKDTVTFGFQLESGKEKRVTVIGGKLEAIKKTLQQSGY